MHLRTAPTRSPATGFSAIFALEGIWTSDLHLGYTKVLKVQRLDAQSTAAAELTADASRLVLPGQSRIGKHCESRKQQADPSYQTEIHHVTA